MRLGHFAALEPICPRCRSEGRSSPLVIGLRVRETGDDLLEGTLLCPDTGCRLEFPVIDGIPIIVPDVQAYIAANLQDILARDDLGEAIESLIGDAAGQGSVIDAVRQRLSIYAWDGYGMHDPEEADREPWPGAVSRCLGALIDLAGAPAGPVLDLACAVGATTLDLAARTDGLVLGIDLGFSMLRLARRALTTGTVSYPRRRIGLVYDRRSFPLPPADRSRIDFWACDALALPLPDRSARTVVALNLLDCVPSPLGLLGECRRLLEAGGRLMLATPYDWSTGATDPRSWIGGHSQRGFHAGGAEPLLEALLTPGAHLQTIAGLRLVAQQHDHPWQTRLHDRSTVGYREHLIVAEAFDA